MYQKVSGNEKWMDLMRFVSLMQILHAKCYSINPRLGETLAEFVEVLLEG
jgi:hypothetical protein